MSNDIKTVLIWSNPHWRVNKFSPRCFCEILHSGLELASDLTGRIQRFLWLAILSRQWARRPSALTGPDDIISTGSQWRGESLQWLRANGPDVRATWPVPGPRMLPSTEPVMQSRGSAVCRPPLLRHEAYCSSFSRATVLITLIFLSNSLSCTRVWNPHWHLKVMLLVFIN